MINVALLLAGQVGRRGRPAVGRSLLSSTPSRQIPYSSWIAVRHMSFTEKKDDNNNENAVGEAPRAPADTEIVATTPTTADQAQDLIVTSTTGIGQVIFLNSPLSGGILWTGWVLSNPTLAGLGLLGAVTATATSKHVFKVDNNSWKDGLWGYNGALVGCAAGVSLLVGPTSSLAVGAAATMFGAAATPLVQSKLQQHVITASPQWTYAFNFVTLSMLGTSKALTSPSEVGSGGDVAAIDAATATSSWMDVLVTTPLVGISQIFLVESALSGGVIVAGIATYSPGLAAHAIMGSAIGSTVGVALWDVPLTDITNGLWGYNAALSSMAVGVFWSHSIPTVALSATSAALTACLFGAVTSSHMLGDLPCFTLPFCVTMTLTHIVMRNAPNSGSQGMFPLFADAPHSPEKNTAKTSD